MGEHRAVCEAKVSVLLPIYNNADFLQAAIESVLAQSHHNIEIVVCDDGSSDNSMEIVAQFNDERIKVYSNEHNIGAEKNWNKVLSLATGEYIKIMGADDLLDPDCIALQLEPFANDPKGQIALVTCQRRVVNSKDKVILSPKAPRLLGEFDRAEVITRTWGAGTNIVGEPVVGLFRKSDAEKTSGFYAGDTPYMIDMNFWFKLLEHGKLHVIPPILCSFRISNNSWSARIGFKQFFQFINFMQPYLNELSKPISLVEKIIGRLRPLVLSTGRQIYFAMLS